MRRSVTRLGAIALSGCLAYATLASTPAAAATSSPTPMTSAAVAQVVPAAAPSPTSTAVSPDAPDPHPPLGGRAPDGSVPGGSALQQRGLILPPDAPPLPKNLPAQSWVLADLDSGNILAARDPHGRFQPASVLKTLTAITLLPKLPGNQLVTVSPAAANAEGSALGLLAGGNYTVDNLFQALFLVSGNDAAAALADANGGQIKTVADMNAEAARLGAYDTFVQTPSGLDGWQQLTSAYDLSLVLRVAVQMPRFLALDELPNASYPAKSSKYGHVGPYEFDNQSNDFFQSVPGAILSKTGYTDAALHTYAAAVDRNGRKLGVIFLRNERAPIDQWQQAQALFNWGYALPARTPAVGTLINPSSPNPAAAADLPSAALTAIPAAAPETPAVQAATNGAATQHEETKQAAAQTSLAGANSRHPSVASRFAHWALVILLLLFAVVIALRVRQLRRLRRRRIARQRARAVTQYRKQVPANGSSLRR